MPFLRKLANDVVMDVLFYQLADHRKRMQAYVAAQIDSILLRLREHHPEFCGKARSILLHSYYTPLHRYNTTTLLRYFTLLE